MSVYIYNCLYLTFIFLLQTSLQARMLWHKLATETPITDYLQTKEPEVKVVLIRLNEIM